MRSVDWKRHPSASLGTTALCCAAVLAAAASLPSATRDIRAIAAQPSRIPDAEIAAGVSLSDIGRPEDALVAKVVETTTGEEVGRIVRVLLSPDGEPRAVEIQLTKGLGAKRQRARIDPENLLYLPQRDKLVTRFNTAETAQLLHGGKEADPGP